MREHTPRSLYLDYLQTSLADGSRQFPKLDSSQALEVPMDALLQGQLNKATQQHLQLQAKKASKTHKEDHLLWPIPVAVYPRVFSLRPRHGYGSERLPRLMAPVSIQALLLSNGQLVDDDSNNTPVVFDRKLLEPSPEPLTLGTVEDADTAYARHSHSREGWAELLEQAQALSLDICGHTLNHLSLDTHVPLDHALVLHRGVNNATAAIENLVDSLRAQEALEVPLFERLILPAQDLPLRSPLEQLALGAQHLGQMEYRYGLAHSQREALTHFLNERAPAGLLTVDGPPGTGKTTLLLSVIATEWVKAALNGAEAPVMVATSTNNQAVLNILRTFAEIPNPPSPYAGRWLPTLCSYGLHLPSQQAKASEHFPAPTLKGMGRAAHFDAQAYETPSGCAKATEFFLQHARMALPKHPLHTLSEAGAPLLDKLKHCTSQIESTIHALLTLHTALNMEPEPSRDLPDAVHSLHTQIALLRSHWQAAQSTVGQITALHRDWLRHRAAEPWWMAVLSTLGAHTMSLKRDLSFLAEAETRYPQEAGDPLRAALRSSSEPSAHAALSRSHIHHTVLQLLKDAESACEHHQHLLQDAENRLTQAQQALEALHAWVPQGQAFSTATIQATLDQGPRHEAFKWASHHWEWRYLSEVTEQLERHGKMDDSRSPDKLLRQYRRLSKLYPCMVSTLYTLPRRFEAYRGAPTPLFNAIDLLIVDEAGQIPPEIGAPAFALAQRALVVGDVDQIKPVWSIPRGLDLTNATQAGVIPALAQASHFRHTGLSASGSSLMQLAQRATPYAKHPQRGRGLFLSEHRRCWPEIINICNQLVYQGLLQPCRAEGARALRPSLGYAHLPGTCIQSGSSRHNPVEAQAIAHWLKAHQHDIERAFQADHKPFAQLVAVITPFSAQARALREALAHALGAHHGITVGTVHSLQGAERRLVIFSPTYGPDTAAGNTFFDKDPSILNVALSRAQDAFLVFGNMHLFHPSGKHPSAIVGRALFQNESNEITDLPAELATPKLGVKSLALIRDLNAHRQALSDAFSQAQRRLIVVSPFLRLAALTADCIPDLIQQATERGVTVRVVTDPSLNTHGDEQDDKAAQFEACIAALGKAGAHVHRTSTQGVHSKLLLVDNAWLIVGSFNWLSASRNPGHARYESSLRYDGPEAVEMIGRTLSDLKELIAKQEPTHGMDTH